MLRNWRSAPKAARQQANFKDQLLDSDYFYTHSEPHRQRPTIVKFPQFIVHTATFYAAGVQPTGNYLDGLRKRLLGGAHADAGAAFEQWLTQFNDSEIWRRRTWTDSETDTATPEERWSKADPFDKHGFLEPFARICRPVQSETQGGDEEVEFFFEAVHRRAPDVVVRVEAHREYFCVGLFSPLQNEADGGLRNYFQDMAALTPDDWQSQGHFHPLFHSLARLFPNGTFANFRGVVCDERCMPPAPAGLRPSFAPYDATSDAPEPRNTERYLRSVRKELAASVFEAGGQDSVACYLQRGQAIYVSSLGSQPHPNAKEELRYLLLYDYLADSDTQRDRYSERYRHSRLVFRINAIGTLRLAAMHQLRSLRGVSDELRRIEVQLEEAAHSAPKERHRQLMAVIEAVEDLATAPLKDGVLIFYRTARARYYFEAMQKLLKDLDVRQIPDWQTYEQFLHRRLFSTLEFASQLGQRLMDLWELARSRAELIEARTLLWLQTAATYASIWGLPLAFAQVIDDFLPLQFGQAAHALVGAAIPEPVKVGWTNIAEWFLQRLPDGAAGPLQTLTEPNYGAVNFWLLYLLFMGFWAGFFLVIGSGRRSSVEVWRPLPASVSDRREPSAPPAAEGQ